jgi:hypothetical protein
MRRRHIAIISLAVTAAAWAPMRSIRAQSANPCVAALASESPSVQRAAVSREPKSRFGADTRDIRDLLQLTALATQTRALDAADLRARPAATARPAADVNDIAVLEDSGDLILRANPFDLANSGVRFEPNGSSYVVSAAGSEFRTPLGRAITLGDDDTATQTLAAPLTFYGRGFTSLFINSDGNVTFDEGDNASTARGLARLTGGPPRMAPFFADLDPSAGGRVYFNATSDTVTVTWCAVPGFELVETVTAQVVVQSSGAIEFRFGTTDLGNGIVALSPGATGSFTPVNLNRAEPASGGPGAIGERFSRMQSLDLVAASRRFYETHADAFDQLVFWTDSPVIEDAFAFETTVQNAITGIGQEVFDAAPILGSAGVLQSVVNMDRVSKYGDTPSAKLFGEMSPLGILAHETGHRWLARLMFRNADRTVSDQLLGRQLAHWSFFMDSDGSVMEGNEIEDQRGGVFRTAAAPERYSRLDMYAMGLATEAEVAPWFFIDSPVSTRTRETPPTAGITINGTRRDVLIQDVIAALGPRVPSAGDSPRVHRQAFVFIRRAGASPDPQDLTRLRRIREQWPAFFTRATENRMTVQTSLSQ